MISKLLQLLEENQGEMDLYSLGRQLGAQPSAVEGMFQVLMHKGRVIEIGSDCGTCSSCNLNNQCQLPIRRIKRYRLSEPNIPGFGFEDVNNTSQII
jgi:hypothetical protein